MKNASPFKKREKTALCCPLPEGNAGFEADAEGKPSPWSKQYFRLDGKTKLTELNYDSLSLPHIHICLRIWNQFWLLSKTVTKNKIQKLLQFEQLSQPSKKGLKMPYLLCFTLFIESIQTIKRVFK